MIRQINTDGVRPHELSDRKVRCPNVRTYGADAKTGHWVTFNTTPDADYNTPANGRVLGCVNAPFIPDDKYPCERIEDYLSVLTLSHDLTYAFIRWVNPANVTDVTDTPPAKLLAFMTGPMPDPLSVYRLAHYGSLSEAYVHGVPDRLAAMAAGTFK